MGESPKVLAGHASARPMLQRCSSSPRTMLRHPHRLRAAWRAIGLVELAPAVPRRHRHRLAPLPGVRVGAAGGANRDEEEHIGTNWAQGRHMRQIFATLVAYNLCSLFL